MRNRFILLADIVAIVLAATGAHFLRFGWVFYTDRSEFLTFVAVALVIKVAVFFRFGLYQRYWKYMAFWDLMAVVFANSAASLAFVAVMVGIRLTHAVNGLPRLAFPLDWLLTIALTIGVRASARVLAETIAVPATGLAKRARRVLIVGAGAAGTLMVREIQKNPQLGMLPIGYLDDDSSKFGKKIHGVSVLGTTQSLADVVRAKSVEEVIIAIPTAGGGTLRAIVDACRASGVPSRAMPGIFEILDGQLTVSRLREVEISDLLRRPQVQPRDVGADYLEDRVVIVTGAGGSIGSELCRQVSHSRPKLLVLLGHGENTIFQIAEELRTRFPRVALLPVIADVRDRERIMRVFRDIRPDIVFHAAAHKHVTLMEENVGEAITNNVAGTRNVVDASLAAGTPRLVLVSTDKAVAPTSVMGASKRVAEMIVREAAERSSRAYAVVRFGNVLGSRGSVVPIFRAQIERGGPVTVTHPEVRRYFMTIPEAVHLILRAGGLASGSELFVLDMGEPVLLRDLAFDMIRLSGFKSEEIPVVFTGLRQGEKLAEVLWEDGSEVRSTAEPDVRQVTEPALNLTGSLTDTTVRLIEAALKDDAVRVRRLLADCLPSASLDEGLPGTGGPKPSTLRSVDLGA